ncbi:hypothetical protein [Tunturiibacter gelidiferens]|uniref:hypothetical protein n=1 Tax=Tunturiibacter gelidiferens TaxID=3069689 RepID=UPI003D9BC58B
MPSTLDPNQLASFTKQPVNVKRTKEEFVYDPAYDKHVEGMFRRKWDEEETFKPHAKQIWSALFQPVIGNSPAFGDVPMLMSIAERTKSDVLRGKALACLKLHLMDCSGVDGSLKDRVQETLNNVTGVAT